MSERPPIDPESPDFHETLVAYLDGELEADVARKVEQLIAREPQIEVRLRNLERAWNLLDELPRAEVDPSFTRSTVEMAALAIEDDERTAVRGPIARGALAATLVVGLALAGFAAARQWPGANAALLRNLPIIEHLEAYRQTPDLDFLRKLKGEKLFATETPEIASVSDIAERRRLLTSLNPEEKDELQRNYERFLHLPPDEQRRLELLQSSIAADDERSELETTIAAFDRWLEQLPGVERAELMALEGDARLSRVQRLRQEEQRRLSQADSQVLLDWIEERLARWLSEKPMVRRQLESADAARRRELLARAVNELRRTRLLVFMNTFFDPAARQALHERLSPAGQRQLDDAQSPEQRRLLMQSWFMQALSPPVPGRGQLTLPQVDEDELKRFFEHDLDPAQRAQLLNMPADQMRRQLLRMYQARQARRPGTSS